MVSERTFSDVLDELAARASNTVAKGRSLERLVKAFLMQDAAQSRRFDQVWLWGEWPGSGYEDPGPDRGIDLVARERDSGSLVAIQCKFYAPGNRVDLHDISTFFAAYGKTDFDSGIIVSTSDNWTDPAETALKNRDKPVVRWGPEVFENSSIDWSAFDLDRPAELSSRTGKSLRDYQQTALDKVLAGFGEHDRGKLIMACGSGKTFTALRIAEQVAGEGGSVLFLIPSISLLSQSLNDWANDAELPLKPFAVCSDSSGGRNQRDSAGVMTYDLTEPASTDSNLLKARFQRAESFGGMRAVFSTYQSLDVVAKAQQGEDGLPEFDLIVCDEAHRTTGAKLSGDEESNFRRVHDNGFIRGRRRLYMTATPRVYGNRATQKANEYGLTLASMSDETLYGPEFHRLGFGEAIERGILSDYKVVIFNVDAEQVGLELDALLSAPDIPIDMSNGAKMVGCWNGLGKQAAEGVDFGADTQPARRAVAFSNTIPNSKRFQQYFPQVIDACLNAREDDAIGNHLRCQVEHVDGTHSSLRRARMLDWLRHEPEGDTCKILSNARCLTEGIDVPALDAILFLEPRKSHIDVVQAVGRVMRKAPGKEYGYIILPVAVTRDADGQQALENSAYDAIWQIINAIRSHDDRFNAKVNQLALTVAAEKDTGDPSEEGTEDGAYPDYGELAEQLGMPLFIAGTMALRKALLARIVDKYSDPRYWEQWGDSVQEIARRCEARIRALLQLPESGAGPPFRKYLAGIRQILNEDVSEEDAIQLLAQHIVSGPVFDALFEEGQFAQHNPVSQALEGVTAQLQQCGLEKETAELADFYRDVRLRAQGVSTASGKQQILSELYQRFFQKSAPEQVKSLGIVYTPVEVVDWIIRSAEDLLQHEFGGASFGDAGLHVWDPFTGTGTFIARLLQSGIIEADDLRRKYAEELHANELNLLAYYIAAVNIESAYHDAAQADGYRPFPSIVMADTFQSYETGTPMDAALFPGNNERIERQKEANIQVIMGNPPWSATNNRDYPGIDERIRESYSQKSEKVNRTSLRDPYYRAIRLASDRVQGNEKGGVVAFVTNGGFIDANAADGFRKALAAEFDAIYCYNLRGDARTSGAQRKRERDNVFPGTRAGVALLLLVKRPANSTPPTRTDTNYPLLRYWRLSQPGAEAGHPGQIAAVHHRMGNRHPQRAWRLDRPAQRGIRRADAAGRGRRDFRPAIIGLAHPA